MGVRGTRRAATVLLSVDNQGDQTQLQSLLAATENLHWIEGEHPRQTDRDIDIWVLDAGAFERNKTRLGEIKTTEEPHFLPVLLLCPENQLSALSTTVWERIDDIVSMPVKPDVLHARLRNLLHTRHLSQQALHSQQRFESLVDTTSSAVIFLTLDGTIQFLNQACLGLFGYERGELQDQPITTLLPNRLEKRAADAIGRYATRPGQGNVSGTLESMAQHKDGYEIPIQLSYSSFHLDGTVYLTGIITDRTAVKRRETRLQVLNRVLRHDIRNDMNVILSYAELLQREQSGQHEYLQKILDATDDIIELSEQASKLDDLFDATRQATEVIDVRELVHRKCAHYQTHYPDVSLESVCPDDEDMRVEAINLIDSALDNIIENAIEHNDAERTEITVTLRSDDDAERRQVLVEVADNGPGLPPEEIEVIETETETPLEHASGLGLWLINWIIKESNGTVEFSENEPRGARITLSLPAHA